jgi:hypothetical protein
VLECEALREVVADRLPRFKIGSPLMGIGIDTVLNLFNTLIK